MWLSWQTSCLSNLDDAPFLHFDSPQSWVLCQRVPNHLEELHRSPLKLARWGNHLQRWLGHQCHNWTMHWQICTEVQCACYKYALPLETYIYEWVYWYFVFMDVHVYSCPTSQWPHDGGDMALPPREGLRKNHFYFFFLYSMPRPTKICENDFSMTASKANVNLQKFAHFFARTC